MTVLEDIEAIKQLKARYFRFLDTQNLEGLQGVFSDDLEVHWTGGDYEIALHGWPALRDFYQKSFTPERFGMHTAHHPEIEVTGDTATGLWYLHDIFISRADKIIIEGSALYEDDYVRSDGVWRIRTCRYNRLLEFTRPIADGLRVTCIPTAWKSAR